MKQYDIVTPHGTLSTQNGTIVMGILNTTPDSFSDGGKYVDVDEALKRTEKMLASGAHIIDVGGESTRPGAAKVDEETELGRVLPVIEAIRDRFPQAIISIDTYKSRVAHAALQKGASMLNDVWGGQHDPDMYRVAKEANVPIVLMHNKKET
ncbi:MAG: dihydropteroate synthase, partial [Bacilli bacterium]